MENPKNQLATKLKEANNVLVTVSANPTVDQLSAAIGLTLFLTKLKKHATTVFSGQIPSTIDFLKPEETIETNTDSLRDFIISLDKNKADKIRYKVEDTMVKIFITPYRTSITDEDLLFSQGDFNVDVVVALGIQKREDIDQAIMAHGRILHDATVATVNISESTDLGTLNWTDPQASSLCEMMVALTDLLKTNSLDGQMATALLTGIVAETERFSNEKTSSTTMNASAKLMAAGANQQLVATKLQPPEDEPPAEPDTPQSPEDQGGDDGPKDATLDDDGSLRINHHSSIPEIDDADIVSPPTDSLPKPWTPDEEQSSEQQTDPQATPDTSAEESSSELHIEKDNRPMLGSPPSGEQQDGPFGLPASEGQRHQEQDEGGSSKRITTPPQFGGQLTGATQSMPEADNPLNLPPISRPMLSRRPQPAPEAPPAPPEDGPPEPYTVFEPESEQPQSEKPESEQPTPPTANFPRAVEPVGLNLPPPPPMPPAPKPEVPKPEAPKSQPETPEQTEKPQETGHSFVDMGDKTLDQIEDKVAKPAPTEAPKPIEPDENVDYKQEAVNHIAKVMSDKTLDEIEEKVGKVDKQQAEEVDYKEEAAKLAAKVMSDKTLDEIEEKVSPQRKQEAEVKPPEAAKKEQVSALSYESHESEPADKAEQSGAKEVSAEDTKPVAAEKAEVPDESKEAAKQPAVAADKTVVSTPPKPASTETQQPASPTAEAKPAVAADANDETKQNEARDAVMRAISAGGDGRTSLPPLQAVGTAGAVQVGHDNAAKPEPQAETPPPVPPPMPSTPKHSGPSPNISIDPEDGTLVPLPPHLMPSSEELPADATAASGEGSAPPVPPPMMPTPVTAETNKN